jgi:hypothetical protein
MEWGLNHFSRRARMANSQSPLARPSTILDAGGLGREVDEYEERWERDYGYSDAFQEVSLHSL